MASNYPSGPEAAGSNLADNVTVRIITLAHGDRTENDLYLVLNIDTTVGDLKQRIEDGLSQHPHPETQRLLYYGRPLLDNNATLRQVLRQEQRSANPGTSHVLHLVIRDGQESNTQRSTPQLRTAGAPQTHTYMTNPQHAQIQIPQIPQMPAGIPQLAHNMIHNSMHMMQHQMQHQRAVEEANRRARGIHGHIAPSANDTRPQARTQAQTPHNDDQPPTQPIPSIQVIQTPQMLGLPAMDAPTPPSTNPLPSSTQTTRIQETVGPNGERLRTVVNNNSLMFQMAGNNVPNPFDRPSSAPGASPPADSDPANRVNGPTLPHIQIRGPPPVLPAGFPFPMGNLFPLPIPQHPQLGLPPLFPTAPSVPSQGQPMAWLLSSPQGPQGIVFAPGHGFFSSNSPSVTLLSQAPNQTLQPTPTIPLAQNALDSQSSERSQQSNTTSTNSSNHNPPPPQPGAQPQPNGQEVAAPQAGDNGNDLLQLFINRGWLFLRLYMFVFIFSESGTWRRIIMLGSIIIYCLLPQQNPLTDMFNVMRQHFDRLIGPPQIPERQAPLAAVGNNQQLVQRDHGQLNANTPTSPVGNQAQTDTRPTPTTGRPMPTPEETARRLLAQHQDRRNAHPFLDMLYRIEQGVALFLASLVPGVGERHVRAREEARRILADNERLREESDQQRQESNEDKSSNAVIEASSSATTAATNASSPTGNASSSGADPAGTTNGQQGIRARNTGAQ